MLRKMLGFTALMMTLSACTTPIQMAYDAEVDRLCAIDGGMKIYESVQLPPERFDKYGDLIAVNSKSFYASDRYGPDFKIIEEKNYLKGGDGKSGAVMARVSIKIFRTKDDKLLGSWLSYYRRGGDLPIAPGEGATARWCTGLGSESSVEFNRKIFTPIKDAN